MRIEPYTIDSIIHVIKRGARGMDIVGDDRDKWRFVKSLFILNDVYHSHDWHRETASLPIFGRPVHWPERKPLTRILAWVLMSNHFHFLLQEISEGGTAKFMQRLGGSMSLCFNMKYNGQGSIFQGAYKSRLVDEDAYLRYLMFYIMVKNLLELYPGGITAALKSFDDAWEWALRYPFSSLPVYMLGSKSPIVDDTAGMIASIFKEGAITKKEAFEMLSAYTSSKGEKFQNIMLENW